MAATKISGLNPLVDAISSDDEWVIVDKSDTTDGATGTTKKVASPSFSNTEANGGNPTLKVPPEDTIQVSNLADSANADHDFPVPTTVNGVYKAAISGVLKRETTEDYRTFSGSIDFLYDSGAGTALSLIGSYVAATTGDSTGLTITVSKYDPTDSIRVNIANATTEEVDGYIHIGWVRSDLVP